MSMVTILEVGKEMARAVMIAETPIKIIIHLDNGEKIEFIDPREVIEYLKRLEPSDVSIRWLRSKEVEWRGKK